jgi:hypothetical protein
VTRSRAVALALRAGPVAGAVVLTVALGHSPVAGAFTAQTGTGGSSVTAAGSFCVSPGPQDVPILNDVFTDQAAPATSYSATTALHVQSGAGANRRTYLRFTLPTVPRHCELTAAQLRLRASAPTGGRTVDVYRADPAQNPQWTSEGLTWSNQPAPVGTRAGSASLAAAGIQTWNVTAHALALYAGTNNGFVLMDRTEGQNGPFRQTYDEQSTAGGTPAVLRLTWG